MHSTYVALVDGLPKCVGCGDSGNFAYGWDTLCLRCMFSRVPLTCDWCGKTSISITNHWDLEHPKVLTEYKCIECEVKSLDARPTSFVTLSITPSSTSLDIRSALMYITEESTLCHQCQSPHSLGTVLMPGGPDDHLFSLCLRCTTTGFHTTRPTVSVRIYPGGRFISL